jgi:hypothetical protein
MLSSEIHISTLMMAHPAHVAFGSFGVATLRGSLTLRASLRSHPPLRGGPSVGLREQLRCDGVIWVISDFYNNHLNRSLTNRCAFRRNRASGSSGPAQPETTEGGPTVGSRAARGGCRRSPFGREVATRPKVKTKKRTECSRLISVR